MVLVLIVVFRVREVLFATTDKLLEEGLVMNDEPSG